MSVTERVYIKAITRFDNRKRLPVGWRRLSKSGKEVHTTKYGVNGNDTCTSPAIVC